jgi:hypothetical protein
MITTPSMFVTHGLDQMKSSAGDFDIGIIKIPEFTERFEEDNNFGLTKK